MLRVTVHRLTRWYLQTCGRSKILAGLLALAATGLLLEGWEDLGRWWAESQRPVACYGRAIRSGIVVSLRGLEREREYGAGGGSTRNLPAMDIRGVVHDRSHDDWLVFGEDAPGHPPIPLDAVAVALRAIRRELEPPAVDIRPGPATSTQPRPPQAVRYSGGIEGNIVGEWFFRFDSWMKRASLSEEPIPMGGFPAYWQRAVEALEREVQSCRSAGDAVRSRSNRYWLATDDFQAIQDEVEPILTFRETPLRVLAETNEGPADPLAAEFADRLTAHLADLGGLTPVREIESFARLMAGFAWLSSADPYRDLRPWLEALLSPVDTPLVEETIARVSSRTHEVVTDFGVVDHMHRLELSGGVIVHPRLVCARSGDDALALLAAAILAGRPSGGASTWTFTFFPKAS